MPEPIKTRGKLERRGDFGLAEFRPGGAVAVPTITNANDILDTACEVLNEWDAGESGRILVGSLGRLRSALTTAGCVREVEVERYVVDDCQVWDTDDSEVVGNAATHTHAVYFAAALNRLSQQTGRGE